MIINEYKKYNIIKNTSTDTDKTLLSSPEIHFRIHEEDQKKTYLIHRALKWQLYQNRYGNAHTKTRDEVRGGGKKPWKQKGTGRARAGSSRSPLWKGGGVIFGPRSKTYNSKINKKEKKLAIQTIIYNKYKNTYVVEDILNNKEKANTKEFLTNLNKIKTIEKKEKVLLIVKKKDYNLYLSLRNIRYIDIIQSDQLNILALLKANTIIITIDALKNIQQIYNDK